MPGRRYLCLVTDAYGGTGGIALYNRDALAAMSEDPTVSEIVCLPRVAPNPVEPLPAKVSNDVSGLGGALAYVAALVRQLRRQRFDLIYCAHVNLIPLARLASLVTGTPWVLCIYGIEAWEPPARALARRGAKHADAVLSISRFTLDRFLGWCGYPPERTAILPNAVRLQDFAVAAPSPELVARYGLGGRRVIATLGRLSASEQAKGFDRVIEALPAIATRVPDLAYLIIGSGDDRPRLEALAAGCGVRERVVFAGFVPEAAKAAHYNLADAFVMPSTGEGFGFVFIEAMACGVPVVASSADGGREAVLEGTLGQMVDPFDRDALVAASIAALDAPKAIPEGLAHFDFPHFAARMNAALGRLFSPAPPLPHAAKAATGPA